MLLTKNIGKYISKVKLINLFIILLMIPVWCIAKTTPTQKLYLETEKKINNKKITSLKQIPRKLVNYSLYPYLELSIIRKKLHTNPINEIRDFYRKYEDQPVAKKLNYYFVNQLAQKKKWQDIISYYIDNNSTKLLCLYITAKQNTNPSSITVSDVKKLWLYGKSRPKECDSLFTTWLDNKLLNDKLIWERILLAIDANNPGLVNYLGKRLPQSQQDDIKLWYRVYRSPNLIKRHKLFNKNKPFHHQILITGLKKQANLNIDRSLRYFRELNLTFKFNKEDKYDFYKYVATKMYIRDHKNTENILRQIPYKYYDKDFHAIGVKNSLKNQDWHKVLKRISKIPLKDRKDDMWVYWQARAYEELNKPNIAKTMFLSIANKTNYYGLMACNNLNQFCPVEFAITKPFQADKRKLLKNKNIRRAIELYSINRLGDARTEWNYAVKKLNEKDRFIAANIANELNWHDRSIVTAAINNKEKRENGKDDEKSSEDFLHLEYPLGYKNYVNQYAKKYNLDPAIIYAISRQESHFNGKAKSHAGAMGVMQLMPTTAKRVAKDYKIPYRNKWNLLTEQTNIRLGSAYLQKMLDNHDGNLVLAAAAYNAGPHRVKKWTEKNNSIATDIWIELVPFKETRNYLKKIVTNTAIYRSRIGKPPVQLSDIIPLSIESKN